MMRGAVLLAAIGLSAPAGAALSERDLARAVATPPTDATVPSSLRFTDQRGRWTTLGRVAGGRPLVLIFADYGCRHVCAPGLVMTAGTLAATGLSPGQDYRLAVIGIDARDTPADARRFGRSVSSLAEVARATSLLTGDAATVRTAMRSLGYGCAYDADNDQFAHDAAVYVFASDGTLTALLPELALRPQPLRAALAEQGPVRQTLGERVARLCYGFAAAHGRFAQPVVFALQALSITLLAAAGILVWRRRRA